MTDIAVLGGSGDAYLVCALMPAFMQVHPGSCVVVSSRLQAVAQLFPEVPHRVDDAVVSGAQDNVIFQRSYDNHLGNPIYYCHPCFHRSHVRVDKLTTWPDASQADMYRMLLWLDPETPLALPRLPAVAQRHGTALIITDSTSWPNTHPDFWAGLTPALRETGWGVTVNDKAWPLADLIRRCAEAEWVIGPQCGVMSILVTGRFPCRKTLATPNIDGNRRPEFLARETFPYAYVTKFSNADYDVEEHKISPGTYPDLIDRIVNGANARRLWPHDPRPIVRVPMLLSPGDFFDRLAVLSVKRQRLGPVGSAAQEREYLRHVEAARQLPITPEIDSLFLALLDLHNRTFSLLEALVPAALAGEKGAATKHIKAIRLNRERVRLKREIDGAFHFRGGEVKSYHD